MRNEIVGEMVYVIVIALVYAAVAYIAASNGRWWTAMLFAAIGIFVLCLVWKSERWRQRYQNVFLRHASPVFKI
jgi:hypothetical protein